MRVPPPQHVRQAFGVAGSEPVALAGGRGTSWRCGEVVLKPRDLAGPMLTWQAEVLSAVSGDGRFRVAPPRRSMNGALDVDGWTAWPHLAGRHRSGAWTEIIAAGESFHDAVRAVSRPAFAAERADPWALGDQVAWGELTLDDVPGLRPAPHLARLVAALSPVPEPAQLIHGDLTGNVLTHPGLPPAIIDLSPYWRPPAFATAVVVADALVWEGADHTLVAATNGPHSTQHLLRALIFRLVTDVVTGTAVSPRYRPAVDLACRQAEADRGGPPVTPNGPPMTTTGAP